MITYTILLYTHSIGRQAQEERVIYSTGLLRNCSQLRFT
jgi:hypothetical protein